MKENVNFISTDQLTEILDNSSVVIVDCRFDLTDHEWGYSEYNKNHIPGAIFAHLEEDLSGPVTEETGRHPLPNMDIFLKKCSAWGINPEKQVIVYDHLGGAYAARLWWMLK